MTLVIVGDVPIEVEQWLNRRRAQGLDQFDEVWEGEYHVAPAPHRRHGEVELQLARILGPFADRAGLVGSGPCNIGQPDDYRVPDQAYFDTADASVFQPTASLVVEIVSPGDQSREKFGFYATVGVAEVLIVDPAAATVEWFERSGSGFLPRPNSSLLGVSAALLQTKIRWPQ
ncbi:MAG: Uma2 family endonuclease [Actinomycetota bacterium]|nr:Uma2 family endonuclease [Actinomycetota bacterium]